MNKMLKFVLENKLAIWILTILIVIWGVYATTSIKMESTPKISLPTLSITSIYPNATPEQVADEISEPIEKAISSLEGVSDVSSTSSQNSSSVIVNYDYGIDLDKAQQEIEKAIKQVSFPVGVETPTVSKMIFDSRPVLVLNASLKDGDQEQLTAFVEEQFEPALQEMDGIASIVTTGQQSYQVELQYDEEKLQQVGLTADAVTKAIQEQNIEKPVGLYTIDEAKKSLVVNNMATTLEDLENMHLLVSSGGQATVTGETVTNDSSVIQLKDIATLRKIKNIDSISRVNGKEAISMQIIAAQEANTVEVVNDVKERVTEFEKSNDNVVMNITSDQGKPIEDSIHTMLEKAIFGAIFAVLVILIFLRNFRTTIISIVSIPLSLLTAIVVIKQLDITLNMMTLGALTVAIGRVIDDSIVVVENIFRRMHSANEKLSGQALVRAATLDMFKPIVSSTLVTIAVFAPLAIVDGMVGELFRPFAMTMSFALLASLVVAVIIVPILAHSLFKKQLDHAQPVKQHVEKENKLAIKYSHWLEKALNHKGMTILLAIVLLGGSLALIPKVGFSFLGSDEQTSMNITYTPASGELDKDVNEHVKEVEDYLLNQPDIEVVQSSIASTTPQKGALSTGSDIYAVFNEDAEDFSTKKEKMLQYIVDLNQPGSWKSHDTSSSGTSSKVSYTVSGTDRDGVADAIEQIKQILEQDQDLKDVSSTLAETYDEYVFNVKDSAIETYGVSASTISALLTQSAGPTKVTTVDDQDAILDVIVKQSDNQLSTMQNVLDQKVNTSLGEVKISDLVSIEETTTPSAINRKAGKDYATVSANVVTDDVTSVSSRVEKAIDKLTFKNDVSLNVGGTSADIAASFTQIGLAIIAAIAIVYFVLVVTFGEALAPFVILFSLPFTIIGAVLGLLIGGETFSISAMLGILMLVGIVVTNAIVYIDRVIHLEKEGESIREALLDAARTRLRPIIMTAIATVFALLPLALSNGAGSTIISRGLGLTVIGGLITSTILTLFVVPVVYEGLSKVVKKNRSTIK